MCVLYRLCKRNKIECADSSTSFWTWVSTNAVCCFQAASRRSQSHLLCLVPGTGTHQSGHVGSFLLHRLHETPAQSNSTYLAWSLPCSLLVLNNLMKEVRFSWAAPQKIRPSMQAFSAWSTLDTYFHQTVCIAEKSYKAVGFCQGLCPDLLTLEEKKDGSLSLAPEQEHLLGEGLPLEVVKVIQNARAPSTRTLYS